MTRYDHLAWCKQRALEYVNKGDLRGAVASMVSDLDKHEGTRGSVAAMFGQAEADSGNALRVREWIEGFS